MHTRRYESDPCTWVLFFWRARVWAHRWTTIRTEVGSMIIRGIGQRRQMPAPAYAFVLMPIVKKGCEQFMLAVSFTLSLSSSELVMSSENRGVRNKKEKEQLRSTAALITEEIFLFSVWKHSEEKLTTLMQ